MNLFNKIIAKLDSGQVLTQDEEAFVANLTGKAGVPVNMLGVAGDPERIGTEYMPETTITRTDAATIRYLRINADQSISELSQAQLLSDLTPNRILYVDDLPAAWFNGSNTESVGVIPLTAAQAVVGTKIRLRGFVKIGFQGNAPIFGGDCVFFLAFNVAADAATLGEGALFVVNAGTSFIIHVDAELELKAATTGKYKVGVTSSQVSHGLVLGRTAASPITEKWWNEADAQLFRVDPTTPEDVASTAGLVVQLQTVGGTTDQSLCNVWMDLNYEIITP